MTSKRSPTFTSVFLENYDAILNRLSWRLGSHHDGNDAAQDLYLKLQTIKPAEDIRNLRSYLFRIADNMALDRLRKRNVHSRYFTIQGTPEVGSDEPSPEAVTDYRQRLATLKRIVEALPPRQREAFLLHKFQELSHADIADRMNISRSAVEKLMMKAMANCREKMDDLLHGDD